MSPHGSKDVVKLNVDSREGQESRNNHLEETAAVPRHLCRDLTRHLRCSGGSIKVMARVIFGSNASQYTEREGYQREQSRNGEDGREGQGTRRTMCQCNGIDPHEHNCRGYGEEASGEEHTTHPSLAVHLEVKTCRNEASNGTREAVEHNHTSQNGSTSGGGDHVGEGKAQEYEGG